MSAREAMKVSDFSFDLPEHLIAQHPLPGRADSRLLTLDRASGALADRQFRELPDLLAPGDLMVFNDTRVIPARLVARKPSGGRVEVLLERLVDESTALAQLRVSRKPAVGTRLQTDAGRVLEVLGRDADGFWRLTLGGPDSWLELLEAEGHMPLPPYIQRDDIPDDRTRYQTVFARTPGAVAAPTAGLHFDEAMMAALDARGVRRAFCTLHVGAGTFQPVRVENLEDHRMHAEQVGVGPELVEQVKAARSAGGRVIAVGTTAVRSLETAAAGGSLEPFTGESRLFIRPGYSFKVVDGLVTNFHLPRSTLLMLVSALAGRDRILAAYRHAVEREYRFFSYGDAMFII